MSVLLEGLLVGWTRNLEYARKLVADIPEDRRAFQPAANMNHPAWAFSHLNLYHDVMVSLIKGQTFADPKEHPFGMQSKPQADAKLYKPLQELIADYARGHQQVEAALRTGGDKALDQAMSLERWRTSFPKVGVMLPYLMLVHESTHLGQISVWRRVQGLPAV